MTALVTSSASFFFCCSDFPGQSLMMTCGIASSPRTSLPCLRARGRPATARRRRLGQKDCCCARRAQGSQHASAEHCGQTGVIGQQAESWGAKSERHVEKNGVRTHGEPPIPRGHEPNGFDTEARINQRVTESGEGGSGQRQRKPGREPDQSQACCFDEHTNQRDLSGSKEIAEMAEKKARQDER